MKVKVYMPYFSYTNDDFDVENAYKSESDYVKAMEEAYNSTKDIITETMSGSYSGNFTGTDGNTYKFGAKEAKKDKISFTGCECVIYNEAGKPDSVDGLIDHFAKGDDFLETIVADLDGAPEEFLTQWGSWIGEHKRVNRAGEEGRKNGEWCWINQPVRELRIEFKNKANETVYAKLINCKIAESTVKNMILIFTEKLDLIDKIDEI